MEFYRYWVRGRVDREGQPRDDGGIVALGWSNASEEDARQRAIERAQRAASRLRSGESPGGGYPYPGRPVREPIVDAVEYGDHQIGMITINSYGAYVLNTSGAMFVDLDAPPRRVAGGLLSRLFGRSRPKPEPERVQRVREIARSTSGLGLRLYETAAGHRALVTSQPFDPTGDEAQDLLRQFRSDARYIQLCRMQKCFRARLSPKPWRCSMSRPPVQFPWETDKQEAAFNRWSTRYERAAAGHAACHFIETIGSDGVHPAVQPIIDLHDRLACNNDLPLA